MAAKKKKAKNGTRKGKKKIVRGVRSVKTVLECLPDDHYVLVDAHDGDVRVYRKVDKSRLQPVYTVSLDQFVIGALKLHGIRAKLS